MSFTVAGLDDRIVLFLVHERGTDDLVLIVEPDLVLGIMHVKALSHRNHEVLHYDRAEQQQGHGEDESDYDDAEKKVHEPDHTSHYRLPTTVDATRLAIGALLAGLGVTLAGCD